MDERPRIAIIVLAMVALSVVVGGVTLVLPYRASLDLAADRLRDMARTHARLIEAVARFDDHFSHDYPEGPTAATLSQVAEAMRLQQGLGETGELLVGRRHGNRIVLLFHHRHDAFEHADTLTPESGLAVPLARALAGSTGTMTARDYRGRVVLAAYEPVRVLDLGLVAKIDLAEIRAPFLRAAAIAGGLGLALLLVGVLAFLRVTGRLSRRLHSTIGERSEAQDRLRDTAQRLRVALDHSPLVIFQQDLDLRYIWLHNPNPGFPAETVLGRTESDLMPAEEAARLERIKRAVLESGESSRQEVTTTIDGVVYHYDLTVEPLRDPAGRVAGVSGVAWEVTDLEESRAALGAAHARLQSLSRRFLEVTESERRYLARELHDEVGQILTSIKWLISAEAADPERLHQAQQELGLLIERVRSLTLDLRPAALDELGLRPALRTHVRRFGQRSDVAVELRVEGTERGLSAELETAVFRIVQEALTNVVRHARARRAVVALSYREAALHVEISDDGAGFDVDAVLRGEASIGLPGMIERAALLGGRLDIDSAPAEGTRLLLKLPYDSWSQPGSSSSMP